MKILFYNKRTEAALDALSEKMQLAFDRILGLMRTKGTWNIGMPYVRHMSGTPLYEIRLKDSSGIARVLFVSLEEDHLLVLHVFIKKTEKTPRHEIELALQRLKEVKRHG